MHDVLVNADIDAQNRLAKAQEQLSDANDQAEADQLKVCEAQAELSTAEQYLKAIKELIAARDRQAEPAEKPATEMTAAE